MRDKVIIKGNLKYYGEFYNDTLNGKGTMIFEVENEIY